MCLRFLVIYMHKLISLLQCSQYSKQVWFLWKVLSCLLMSLFQKEAVPNIEQSTSHCCSPTCSMLSSELPNSCMVLLAAWWIGRKCSYRRVTAHNTDAGRALIPDLGVKTKTLEYWLPRTKRKEHHLTVGNICKAKCFRYHRDNNSYNLNYVIASLHLSLSIKVGGIWALKT